MGINRGTVLNLINDVHREGGFKDYNSYSYLFNQVDTMPESKEDTEPHWIPVTERLPEGIGRVIAQMAGGAIHDMFYKGKNPYGHVVWVRLDDCIYWDNEVVAWMPLPEPYKGVTE